VRSFYLSAVWVHVLSAVVWIGGMVFLSLVLIPVTRGPAYQAIAVSLVRETGLRFRRVGWSCLGLLLVSGTFNLGYRGFGWADLWTQRLFEGPFGHVLRLKLLLVAVILLLSTLHDFVVGPRATALARTAPGSHAARRLRMQASWIGRLNLLLSLVVVALGVMLVRGSP
jgi:uncharacterized membrane protein